MVRLKDVLETNIVFTKFREILCKFEKAANVELYLIDGKKNIYTVKDIHSILSVDLFEKEFKYKTIKNTTILINYILDFITDEDFNKSDESYLLMLKDYLN